MTAVEFGSESEKVLSWLGNQVQPFRLMTSGASPGRFGVSALQESDLGPRLFNGCLSAIRHALGLAHAAHFVGPTVVAQNPYPPPLRSAQIRAIGGTRPQKRKTPDTVKYQRLFYPTGPDDKSGLCKTNIKVIGRVCHALNSPVRVKSGDSESYFQKFVKKY